jgi:hypothetical protein
LPRKLYIPSQVIQSIREHLEKAVKHAESGYSSAQEEEDTITGELGGALRTNKVQFVYVTDLEVPGTWRWSITYSKFRSKARDATESIIGADGIVEITVGSSQRDQRKSALFQAKNIILFDSKLIEQCAKMSIWREASFVISYSANGYFAYSIDDILQSGGIITKAKNGIPLATWFIDTFIGCRIGHPNLYYVKDERRLYWERQHSSKREDGSEWIWVDFSPKHLIQLEVSPPNWEMSRATEIFPSEISLSRIIFTPEDLFGIEAPFTMMQLKKRRAELLHAYHSDKYHRLRKDIQELLDARVKEINRAFSELSKKTVKEPKWPDKQENNKTKAPVGLEEPIIDPLDDFFVKKKEAEKVKVQQNKKNWPPSA